MKMLVVESPNKVKKIEAILGAGWRVVASVGHVRDLPEKELGVDESTFQPHYVFIPERKSADGKRSFPGGKARVDRIAKQAASAATVLLATDPDREGEAIAWHLARSLKLRNAQRVTFSEITSDAINKALNQPRDIDMDLVHAQEARRVLDRLFGYKVTRAVSDLSGTWMTAGRVQSPAVRLVVERERDIKAFKVTQHYGAKLHFSGSWSATWNVSQVLHDGQKYLLDEAAAQRAAEVRTVMVASFKDSAKRKGPPAPFTTSTMQQAASVSAKLRPKVTMDAAQKLFEQGAISYHRTDSPNLSDAAFDQLEAFAKSEGMDVVSERRKWKSKGGSQESHEAIRPTDVTVEVAGDSDAERALYALIRQRAIACVLPDAEYAVREAQLVAVNDETLTFKAAGRKLTKAGWKALYNDDAEDEGGDKDAGDDNPVPALVEGAEVSVESGEVLALKTKAPARYTEASLIKAMEDRGIGRPSTYAAIMENIVRREYIGVDGQRKLSAMPKGERLVDTLVGAFAFVDLDYTAELEDRLDKVAGGKHSFKDVVGPAALALADELAKLGATVKPAHSCPACGKAMRRRQGKDGFFWGCSAYPDCKHTAPDQDGEPGERKTPPTSKEHKCGKCGKGLIHRVKKGDGGYDFWGCSGYPVCKQSYDSDTDGPKF